jgi:hypothetical protein
MTTTITADYGFIDGQSEHGAGDYWHGYFGERTLSGDNHDRYGDLNIVSSGFGRETGRSNFLHRCDTAVSASVRVVAGDHFRWCGWVNAINRFGADDTGVSYPTRRLRTVAQAVTTHGAYHPGCFLDGTVGTLATITFTVFSDRTRGSRFAPNSNSIAQVERGRESGAPLEHSQSWSHGLDSKVFNASSINLSVIGTSGADSAWPKIPDCGCSRSKERHSRFASTVDVACMFPEQMSSPDPLTRSESARTRLTGSREGDCAGVRHGRNQGDLIRRLECAPSRACITSVGWRFRAT